MADKGDNLRSTEPVATPASGVSSLFALAFQHAPMGMHLSNSEGIFIAVNRAFCSMAGRRADELIGQPTSMVMTGADAAEEMALAQRMLDGQLSSAQREDTLLCAHGSVLPVAVTTSVVRADDGGEAIFLTQLEDVSFQRRAEEAVALTEHAVEAIVSADMAGRVASWNPGAEAMFGYRAADAVGQKLDLIIPNRFRAAHHAGLSRVAGGGSSHMAGGIAELVARRRDGTELPSRCRSPGGSCVASPFSPQ